MKRLVTVFLFTMLANLCAFSQFPNTSSWIINGQQYFRLAVIEDGIHSVSKDDLKALGVPTETIANDFYRIFEHGKEIPINVTAESIEFYAERAKGDLDSLLYEVKDDQIAKSYSHYVDTAYYYLTFGSISGLRYTPQTNTSTAGLNKVREYKKTVFVKYNSNYELGERLYPTLQHPAYKAGDCWVSKRISRNLSISNTIDLSDFKAGGIGTFKTTVIGANNRSADAAVNDGYNNQILIEINNGSWIEKSRKLFAGFTRHDLEFNFDNSDLNVSGIQFKISHDRSYNGNATAFRGVSNIAEVEITYDAVTFLVDGKKGYFELPASNVDQHIEIGNISSPDMRIFDQENNWTFNYIEANDKASLRLPASNEGYKLVISTENSITPIKPIKTKISATEIKTNTDYLIISSKKLSSSAIEYQQYRSSASGGGFNVELAYVEDIFKEYYFGYHHPLAVKLYLNEVFKKNIDLENVLFIGKALNPSYLKENGVFNYDGDLVPSIGSPCSDWYFGYKIDNNRIVAPFSIGRISALKNQDVLNYLAKVKAHSKLGNEPWRKDVMHISGGKSGAELTRFSNYMSALGEIIESPNVGANVYYFGKEKGLVVDEDLKKVILERANKGLGFYSYFGHAALNVTEVDIGIPIEYNNADKPAVMYFAGCVLGGCYESNGSLGEEFILSETGAVVWLAASTFSFETTVYDFTNTWYNEYSRTLYGKSIGVISQSSIEKFIGEGKDPYKESQGWQMILQGDPALTLYAPEYPDYSISDEDIFVTPEDVTAQSDSFYVNIIIKNIGKAVNEKLPISYTLNFPDGTSLADSVVAANVYNTGTFVFTIYNTNNLFGTHSIEIELDPNNSIRELDEGNNRASYEFTLFSNGSVGLFPPDYGIVNSLQMELIGQSLDQKSTSNIFQFEVDTTPSFRSPWRKQSGDINGALVRAWKVNLLELDSQDYYWRLRLKTNEGYSPWSSKSFSFIENSLEGWAQIDFKQLDNSAKTDIYTDTVDESFNFFRITSPGQFIVQNHGRDFPITGNYTFGKKSIQNDLKLFRRNDYSQVDGNRSYNGIICYVFEPNLNENDGFNSWSLDMGPKVYERNDEMRFDWMKSETEIVPEILDSFISFCNQIPEGYHVLMYSGYYHRFKDLPNRFYNAIESFGSAQIRKVENNGVWLMVGTKGYEPGKAHDEQYTTKQDSLLESSTTFIIVNSKGRLTSQKIGPSKKWRFLTLRSIGINNPSDLVNNSYNIIAIDTVGVKSILIDNFRRSTLDLSFIDAERYPYLQIELITENRQTYSPATPIRWIVNYDYLPEGLVSSDVAYSFNSDTIQKGQELTFEIGYQNVSNLSLDKIPVQFEIVDKNRLLKSLEFDTLKALAPGESIIIKRSFSSDELLDENKLVLKTNPNLSIPELYSFNNNFEKTFFVEGDKERPTLEVTFDGVRIMDGDIISPKPTIVITGKDNNGFFLLDNPDFFDVYLAKQDSALVRIDENTAGFVFKPASEQNTTARIEFNPARLDDGNYILSIQLRDASGNKSGNVAYSVNFEVVRSSTVTNFYPYPNPFSSNMRFVFTLTGEKEPDDIVVQIMTISGKTVREIHKNELGPIKIGHNTSEFTWDGTDTYGNRLANGVYIYRVKTVIEGKQVEHRNTTSDNSFKEGFGKIYILR
ncbi:MAG: hypothetical protein JXQ87_14145 [Bacteroidia bacterium]